MHYHETAFVTMLSMTLFWVFTHKFWQAGGGKDRGPRNLRRARSNGHA